MSEAPRFRQWLRWIAFEVAVCVVGYAAFEFLVPERFVIVGMAVGLGVLVVGLVLVPAYLYRRGRRTNTFFPAHAMHVDVY